MRRRLGSWLIVAVGSVTLVLTGCGSDTTTSQPQPGADGGVPGAPPSSPPSAPVATAISAAAGGVVSDASGRFVLTIPPGALAQDTSITLAVGAKRGNALVEVGDFGPSGLVFVKPATLAIKADASVAPADQELAVGLEVGSAFTAIDGSTYAAGAASAPIAHFSSFSIIGVPTTGPNGCALQGNGCGPTNGDRLCCNVVDPNQVIQCSGVNKVCCMPNSGVCNRGRDCCNSAENNPQFTTAACEGGHCCSLPDGACDDTPEGKCCGGRPCNGGICQP